jgi:hypothetical protein
MQNIKPIDYAVGAEEVHGGGSHSFCGVGCEMVVEAGDVPLTCTRRSSDLSPPSDPFSRNT